MFLPMLAQERCSYLFLSMLAQEGEGSFFCPCWLRKGWWAGVWRKGKLGARCSSHFTVVGALRKVVTYANAGSHQNYQIGAASNQLTTLERG